MSKYQGFIFKNYDFEGSTGLLKLHYSYDDQLDLIETYKFNFEFADYDKQALDRAIQLLWFMAGVSYYKMYLANSIEVRDGQIDSSLANFLSQTYQKGLREFFYMNELDPLTEVVFPETTSSIPPTEVNNSGGLLVGLGGGKDSLVSVDLLKDQPKIATWSLNHQSQLEPLVKQVGLPHLWVERTWDPQIQTLNSQDALNGHVPISAIFACVGVVVAILSGYREVVVSNESSASDPTLVYKNVPINHQYSKSLEFEQAFQGCLKNLFGDSLAYYSLLRPFSELKIAEIFTQLDFNKYKNVFSSCNRAYALGQHEMSWCGQCAKCAFVFLILTPFIDRPQLENLWHGKNLLLDPALETTYRQLLGISGNKPLDCVGEVKESRTAMQLAKQIYPDLSKYQYEIPEDYDFRRWSQSSMPESRFNLLKQKLSF